MSPHLSSVCAMLLTLTAAMAFPPAMAAPPLLDPGGLAIVFRGAGETPVTGDEMLPNGGMEEVEAAGAPAGWLTDAYVWLPVSDPPRQAQMLTRIKPLMHWASSTRAPHGGQRVMHLTMPMAAYSPGDPAGGEFCAIYHRAVPLPALVAPTKYLLSYHYRGWSDRTVPNSRPYARITFYDAGGRTTRVYAQNIFAGSPGWRRGELGFVAPKETCTLDVRLALTGVGEVFFDDVSLRQVKLQDAGPTVRLMPASYLDNRYCLSSGDAGTMCFGFRNESSARLDKPQLLLRLPTGIEILDTAPAVPVVEQKEVEVDGRRLNEYRLDLAPLKHRIRDGSFSYPYNQWDGLQLIVRTVLSPADTTLAGSYWLEDGTYRSGPLSFDMLITPPLPTVAGPKTFRSGTHLFLVTGITKPEAVRGFAKLYQQVGLNSVHTPACPLGAELGRLGIERYAQPFANGYTMGASGAGQKPADAVFREVDGKPVWEAICPTEVYRRGPYFREQIVNGLLREVLVTKRTAEQLMCNWEPYMYVGRGCFCDRCKEEFRQFGNLPAAELDGVWPKQVIARYGPLWTKFRAWQHGQLMVTLEEEIAKLGQEAGHETHFIPEVHHGLLTATWEQEASNHEYAAVEYMDKLPVINAWAPYNWYVFGRGPYDYIRGQHLNTHVTATEVQRFVADRLPADRRTRLIAFPFGTYEGATPPEALAMEMLTYFLDGYHGAFAYLFPGGYDSRHWRALAEMNRQMALVEPCVTGWTRAARHTLQPATPIPAADARFLDNCAPVAKPEQWHQASLLQSWEYQQGDTRLIAVGNYWERGESFFRLAVPGLPADREYVLREPAQSRTYANERGQVAWTAEELSRGVLLHVGAMRCAFFLLEPYQAGSHYGEAVMPQEMSIAMQQRLRGIQAALDDGPPAP